MVPERLNLKGRDFLSLHDFTAEEILAMIELAEELKEKKKWNVPHPYLQGKTLGMIFPEVVYPNQGILLRWPCINWGARALFKRG